MGRSISTYRRSAAAASGNRAVPGSDERARGTHHGREEAVHVATRCGRLLQRRYVRRRLVSGLETNMFRLELGIADNAYNREVVEGQEFLCVFAFATEKRFA